MRGWLAVIAKAKSPGHQTAGYNRLHSLLKDYQRLPVLDFDERSANLFAELRRHHRRHGAADLKIAAITMIASAKLLSRNLRDFASIDGLRAENPLVH
jgi:predicted nucleic acid-binding protein